MKHPIRCCLCILFVLSHSARGEETADCSHIEDISERLACFDRQFPKAEEQAEKSAQQGEPEPASEPEVVTEPAAGLEVVPIAAGSGTGAEQTATIQQDPGVAADQDTLGKGTIFGKDPKVNLTAAIESIRRGDKQKMVFLLDNDEIWLQVEPRDLPFHEGDTVTIKNGFFGGYFMRTENRVSTRVSRIR